MQKSIKNWLDNNPGKTRILLLIYFIFLTWLLLRPSEGSEVEIFSLDISKFYNDKVIHCGSFFILTCLSIFSFSKVNSVLFVIYCTFYGILIEFLQEITNWGRTFEYYDMVADFTGSVLGFLVVKMFIKNKNI